MKKVKKLEWWEEEQYEYEETVNVVEETDVEVSAAIEESVAEELSMDEDESEEEEDKEKDIEEDDEEAEEEEDEEEVATPVSSDDYESEEQEKEEEEDDQEEDVSGKNMYSDSEDSLDRTKVKKDTTQVINEFADGIPSDEESDQEAEVVGEVEVKDDSDMASQEVALKSEMMSEANKSLALLSSFVGTLPPEEQGEEIKAKEIKPKVTTGFLAVSRFWGNESDIPEVTDVVTPLLDEDNAKTEEEGTAGLQKTEAKFTELKSVFQGRSVKAPESGFAESEDPLTLSGFASISEREPAKQSHTFGFSFDLPTVAPTAAPAEVPVEVVTPVEVAPVQRPESEFSLWGNYKDIKAAALLFSNDTAKDNNESNQNVLRDVKRKLRGFRA